jgi:rod shape-determining protein MreD
MRTFASDRTVPLGRIVLLSATVLVIHVLLFSRFSLFAVRPEPFLLLTIVGALQLGPGGGAVLGCVAGFSADLLSASPLGLWLLVCGIIGLGVGTLALQLATERQLTANIASVVGCTVLGLLMYPALAFAITEQRYPPPLRYLTIIVFAVFWNMALMPIFFAASRRLFAPKRELR